MPNRDPPRDPRGPRGKAAELARDSSSARLRALGDLPFEISTGAHAPRDATPPAQAPQGARQRPATVVPAGAKPVAAGRAGAAEVAPASVEPPKLRRGESVGGDPYSSGPARTPEGVTFNPHDRGTARKR